MDNKDAEKLQDIFLKLINKYGYEETIGYFESLKLIYMIRAYEKKWVHSSED